MLKQICVAGAIFVSLGVQAQTISLTKGQKLQTRVVTSMNVGMEMLGQNIETISKSTNTSTIEVKDITNDKYVLSGTLTRMEMHSSAMGQTLDFDSDKKEDREGEVGKVLSGRLDKAQEIQVDKQGKISSIQAIDSAGNNFADQLNFAEQMAQGQPYPYLLPLSNTGKLKSGDSWVDSTGSNETIKVITTYTVKSVSADEVNISFTAKTTKSGTTDVQGMPMEVNIAGNTTGSATYETGTGLLKQNNAVSTIKGDIGAMGGKSPITISNTVSTTVSKL
ncbi:MAG: hypothetical protein J0I41_16200 [Filimonas sp.]|nr:hypothetical protein [Filimonas sp.]